MCYIYVVFIVRCNVEGGTRNGTRTDHGRSGRHVVSAHGHRHRRCETDVLKPEGKQTLSNLLVYLVVPAMIVNSYRMEFSMEILHNLLASFGMSLLALLIGTGITLALTARRKDSRTPIFRFACIFSNAAYMGFPLISALFGSEGLLYASAYVTVFNILLWTMGYGFVSGSSDPKEVLHSLLHTPVLYAMVIGLCIYLLQIPVPQLIAQPLELMAT